MGINPQQTEDKAGNPLINILSGFISAGIVTYLRLERNSLVLFITVLLFIWSLSFSIKRIIFARNVELVGYKFRNFLFSITIGLATAWIINVYRFSLASAIVIFSISLLSYVIISRILHRYGISELLKRLLNYCFRGVTSILLAFVIFVTRIPNLMFLEKPKAIETVAYANCAIDYEGKVHDKSHVIYQDVPPGRFRFTAPWLLSGILPDRWIWQPGIRIKCSKTLPSLKITYLKTVSNDANIPPVETPVHESPDRNIVNRLHKVIVEYSNFPIDSSGDLDIDVLTRPLRKFHPLIDSLIHRWWVQRPPDPSGPFVGSGRTEILCVFGRPERPDELFEVIAVVTNRELQRADRLWPNDIKQNIVQSEPILVKNR